MQHLVNIALLVNDYDEAIAFYTKKLQFTLVEDTILSPTKRWVRVQPPGGTGCCILLAKAGNTEQKKQVGQQSGGRVFLFIHTDNFNHDYQNLLKHNVKIIRPKTIEPHGTVAVFEDLYGNLFDLIEPRQISIHQ